MSIQLIRLQNTIDLVFVYLGINDLFVREEIGAEDVARDIGYGIEIIREIAEEAEIVLLGPLELNVPAPAATLYRLQVLKSVMLREEMERTADEYGVRFVNTGSVISASEADGVHIEAKEHRRLGRYLCDYVRQIPPR